MSGCTTTIAEASFLDHDRIRSGFERASLVERIAEPPFHGVAFGFVPDISSLVFLGLPQGSFVVHRFCTTVRRFCIAKTQPSGRKWFIET
jgi:hypothetical protein